MAQYDTRVAAGVEEGGCCISAGQAAPLPLCGKRWCICR